MFVYNKKLTDGILIYHTEPETE